MAVNGLAATLAPVLGEANWRPPLGIRKEWRLRHRSDFDNVYNQGRSWNNELLVLRTLQNGLEYNRMGFVTSKKVGNAVHRNLTRRRLQESLRLAPLAQGWDIVVSAKSKAADADYHSLNDAARELLARAGILEPGHPEAAE